MTYSNFDEFPKALDPENDPVLIGGKWKLLHVIGEGGMGKVYAGVAKDHTKSAIKIINASTITEQYLMRFKKEIRAMQLINSTFVSKIYDSNAEDEIPYIAMEYINGITLAKVIENNEEIKPITWFNYAHQILQGLKAIHARGLTHRDIKPANLMRRTDDKRIKIIDFGLVKGDDVRNPVRTFLVGTYAYMSPEQAQFITPTQKSDIFSAGISLVHLFTKKHPFAVDNDYDEIRSRIIDTSPNLSGLSNFQLELCEKMLEKNPIKRPSAIELIRMIQDAGVIDIKKPIAVKKVPVKKKIKPLLKNSNKKQVLDPVLTGLFNEFKNFDSPVYGLQAMKVAPKKTPEKINKVLLNLQEIVKIVLMNMSQHRVFHLDFFSKEQNQNIYYQGLFEENDTFIMEAESNNFLTNKLSQEQVLQMNDFGWKNPEAELPNFHQSELFSLDFVNKISRDIALTAFRVYGASADTKFYISPIEKDMRILIKDKTSIDISDDGTFTLKSGSEEKKNTYENWQLIGYFKKHDEAFYLEELHARNRENNTVYYRADKKWIILEDSKKRNLRVEENLYDKKAYLFAKEIINIFDQSAKSAPNLTFERVIRYLDYAPEISDKFLEEELINPLTDNMIPDQSLSNANQDSVIGIDLRIEESKSLFALLSSDPNTKDLNPGDGLVLGIFAKHPVTGKFFARKNSSWKIIFEDPEIYGYPSVYLKKKALNRFDNVMRHKKQVNYLVDLSEFKYT